MVVFLGVGVVFLVIAAGESAAEQAFEGARECADASSSGCYQVYPGLIRSVSVSQTKNGERDDVMIDTQDKTIEVILEPSASAAPHVRTGAEVSVIWYQGRVEVVEVNGLRIASVDNPAGRRNNDAITGGILVGAALVSGGINLLGRRRGRPEEERHLAADAGMPEGETLLPTGSTGWVAAPKLTAGAFIAMAVVAGLVLLFSASALLDPSRTTAALGFDCVVIGGGATALLLFLRNSRLMADRQSITKVDWLGRWRTVPHSEIARADRFSVRSRYSANKYLVFVDHNGRKLFAVVGRYWNFDQLDRICHSAHIRLTGSYAEEVGVLSMNKRVRGMSTWRGWVGGFALVGLIIVVSLWLFPYSSSR